MPESVVVPPGECTQCYAHAYDKSIHRALGPGVQCQPCLHHSQNPNACRAMRLPKKKSWF